MASLKGQNAATGNSALEIDGEDLGGRSIPPSFLV